MNRPARTASGLVAAALLAFATLAPGCGSKSKGTGTVTGTRLSCERGCEKMQECNPQGFEGQFGSIQDCVDACLSDPIHSSPTQACDDALRQWAECVQGVECAQYDPWMAGDPCAAGDYPCKAEDLAVLDTCANGCGATETVCDDTVDNDNDGLTDCDDSDCNDDPACLPQTETVCDDTVDNDNDGLTDCDDDDCAGDPACLPQTETVCDDTVDNDNDGLTDCDDDDCANDPACQGQVETICDDSADNDGDGLTDCDDTDCANDPVCLPQTETNCIDGLDNDSDGYTDCYDTDCAADQACLATATCSDILSCAAGCAGDPACISACRDDGCQSAQQAYDALEACLAAQCAADCTNPQGQQCQDCLSANCPAEVLTCLADDCGAPGEVVCDDGIDNDNDGDTDCSDLDCLNEPACGGNDWTCSEILSCTGQCGGNLTCVHACRANGCAPAQAAFDAMQACLVANCLADCANSQSQQCQDCMTLNCNAEVIACINDHCQGPVETLCDDSIDNDSDGYTDCVDLDCANDPTCQGQVELICNDNLDNDNDGDTDCGDADCTLSPPCGGPDWTCSEVMDCASQCGGDLACINACRDNGCQSAQVAYDAMQACLIANCLADCGQQGQQCQNCMTINCPDELMACLTDVCQSTSETVCDDNLDNDGDGTTDCTDIDCLNDPACGGTDWSCIEILNCAGQCAGDLACVNACRLNGCTEAVQAYDDVQLCLISDCLVQCAIPSSPECQGCMAFRCLFQMIACWAADCQGQIETDCTDGVDNDSDGATDCGDTDCAANPACQALTESVCDDTVDDDGDGYTDCEDYDCVADPACTATPWTCGQITTCAEQCGSDAACLAACRANGCPAAQTVFDAQLDCMMTNCPNQCSTNPQGPACRNCMNNNCAAEMADCQSNTCP